MNTIVLDKETFAWSVQHLLEQAANGGVKLLDSAGKTVAFCLPPSDKEAWIYAEANLDIDENIDEVRQALSRSGGITTAELLRRAAAAAKEAAEK
jgi:hypothetical protein